MAITPFDYHTDEANHGNYQYVPLKTIVDGFLLRMTDDDHILKNTRRSIILENAKSAIRELNKQVFKDILAIEITIPENLSYALPHDYVNYVRCSIVQYDSDNDSYKLQPLNINRNINIANGYLQDHEWNILFDNDGRILTADSSNGYAKPYKKYEFTESYVGNAYLDTSKLSKHGEFTIDERRGKILFSSDLSDKEIVLEYVSDGISFDTYGEDKIKVHKDALKCVNDYIFFLCIEHKNNISSREKSRALRRFKTTRHQAKIDRSNFDLLEISRVMRTSTKM